jgi:deazaflavin-dependent oxidoreductase (nitroreductase family)
MAMTAAGRVPSFVPALNPLLQRLLRLGVPLGPNGLLTVKGRKSGLDRTTPVAVVERNGRRWIVGTFGDVNWVRNLRAAGEGVITVGRRSSHVTAVELSHEQAADFFKQVLGEYVGNSPIKRALLRVLGAREVLSDPVSAAAKRPVFELR